MTMKVYKDKKLADAVEALVAAVSMVGGIPAGFQYMRSLGIIDTDMNTLQNKLAEINTKSDRKVREESTKI